MIDPDGGPASPPSTDRLRRAYLAFAGAFGVVLLLIAATSLLIALRQWLLPSSDDGFGGSFLGPATEGSNAAVRSLLGAAALALPGAAIVLWHRREAGRTDRPATDPVAWGRSLFLHLVAAVTLVIAGAAAVVALQSVRDAVAARCFPSFRDVGSPADPGAGYSGGTGTAPPLTTFEPPLTTFEPPISIPIDPGFAPEPECYPRTGDALRNALDAGLVAGVAGATWAWHLGRTRQPRLARTAAPPDEEA